MPLNYYNEIDSFAAQWLRNLIDAELIPHGVVDTRDIRDVQPSDLVGFTQCHFFAGIGGWSYALSLAGVPASMPLWTGSCPCQPFSDAGKREGFDDPRHLWPDWFRLIRQCKPPIIFGEQVSAASTIGRANPRLQEMLDRKAVLGVLRKLQRQPTLGLQGMRTGMGAWPEAEQPNEGFGESQSVARYETRLRFGERGEASRENARSTVRLKPSEHPEADRSGLVRGYRHPVRPFDTEGVERPIVGPDRAGTRLHKGERESHSLCAECGGEHLGSEQDYRDCSRDLGSTQREIERLIESDWGEIEGEAEWPWLSAVQLDLERAGYSLGAAILPACSVGAPHIRQRLFFVADVVGARLEEWQEQSAWQERAAVERGGATGELGDAAVMLGHERNINGRRNQESANKISELRDANSDARICSNNPWSSLEWLPCIDGKLRPTKPGLQPLAHGVPARVGRLRAYGNAIVPQVAAEFIRTYFRFIC